MTNKQNLPASLVNAITAHEHRGGADISASQLLKSPRAYWLSKRHAGEIEEDASDNVWALFGTAAHAVAQAGGTENSLTEEYFREHVGKYTVSGSADLYEDGYVIDYKTTSVWSLIFLDADKKAEYISQLNCYAWFLRKQGFAVKGIKIVMLMRDWKRTDFLNGKIDISSQVQVLNLPMYTDEQVEQYLAMRLDAIMQYKDTPDDELPECSEKYRWAKPSRWALMKDGRKTAIKLFDSQNEAESALRDPKQYVEERKGDQWKRCEYCSARQFCNQTHVVEHTLPVQREINVQMGYDEFIKVTKEIAE